MKDRLEKIRVLKLRTSEIIGSLIFSLVIAIVGIAVTANLGQVNLINQSSEAISEGTLKVCGREYSFDKLPPGKSQHIVYLIGEDSGYTLKYHTDSSDQEFLSDEAGYICGGFGVLSHVDFITIFDDHLEYANSPTNKVRVNVSSARRNSSLFVSRKKED